MNAFRLHLILLAALVAGCSSDDDAFAPVEFEQPETFVEYDVELTGVTDDRVRELMEQALQLYRQQEKGVQSVAFLRRRAQGDIETAQKILRSFGWYEARVRIDVDSPDEVARKAGAQSGGGAPGAGGANAPAATDPTATSETETDDEADDAAEAEDDAPKALARVIVNERRRYTLARHGMTLVETGAGDPPVPPDAAALGSPVGDFALASGILDAEKAAVVELRSAGRPYAQRLGRDAVADPDTAEIEVDTTIATGAKYVFGDAVYEGADGVERPYIDTYRTWTMGETVDPAKLREFTDDLIATGLFNAASADFPEEPPEGEVAPVLVRLEEAPPRTISGGVRYDTEAGPAVRGGFQHRNLYGSNETLTLEAIIGLEEQTLEGEYRLPQWLRPGQDLVWGAELRRVDDEAYEELGATLAVGIERELTDEITAGFGILGEVSRTETIDETETAKLVGLPAFLAYDSSDDRLDPSKGIRARIAGTPFAGYQGDTPVSFGILDASASTYFDLTGDKEYIFALRTRLATILSGDIDVVSPSRRLYAGGGGSVRGYGERYIGPLDADGEPTGGRSAFEVGAEMRMKFTDTIGAAAFVEAGSVTEDIEPSFDEGLQVAVGGGLRYFSPVGPIRLDVGVPVNPREADDNFQIYISIGQAF